MFELDMFLAISMCEICKNCMFAKFILKEKQN